MIISVKLARIREYFNNCTALRRQGWSILWYARPINTSIRKKAEFVMIYIFFLIIINILVNYYTVITISITIITKSN